MSENAESKSLLSHGSDAGTEYAHKGGNQDLSLLADFTSPDHFSDITLVVEDKPIHAHKTVLSLASPVWKAMFSGDFKEKRVDFVDLPGKVHGDVVELLEFVYPPCKKSLTDDNVYKILPLTDEYQIQWLKDASEEFLVERILQEASGEQFQDSNEISRFCVQHIYLAQLYSLDHMFSVATNIAAELPFSALKSTDLFSSLDCKTLTSIYEKRDEKCQGRIKFLEHQVEESQSLLSSYQLKCIDIATNALKIKRMGTYVRVCPAEESSTCACDSCIYFGRYFERIISNYSK
ncbi:kelch-like protein 2 [Liolophura sinensis]|uniref:kelch-like protein 2 n=1 Tax=Liolophura sinensis TaxID=3198878 RepID=UPI0031590092